MALWEEYKKFILGIIGAIVFLALYNTVILAPLRSDTEDMKTRQKEIREEIVSKIETGRFRGSKSVRNVLEETKRYEKKLVELNERLEFKVEKDYLIDPADPNLLINFRSLVEQVQRRLSRQGANQGIIIPRSLGFPESDISTAALPEYFQQLDIMEQVVELALDIRCRQILEIGPAENFSDFLGDVPLDNEFIKRNVIVIKTNADFDTTIKFIRTLQEAPRFLSLIRVSLKNDNPESDSLSAIIALAGLEIK